MRSFCVYLLIGLAAASVALMIAGACMPMSRIVFKGPAGTDEAKFDVYLLEANFTDNTVDRAFCKGMTGATIGEHDDFCDGLHYQHSLQDTDKMLCHHVASALWPEFCQGLDKAWGAGIALIVVLIVACVLQLTAIFMLHEYVNRRTVAPIYRYFGFACLLAAFVLFTVMVGLHGALVGSPMGAIRSSRNFPIEVPEAEGKSVAAILFFTAIGAMFVELLFFPWISREREERALLVEKFEEHAEGPYTVEYGTIGVGATYGHAPPTYAASYGFVSAPQPAGMLVSQPPMVVSQTVATTTGPVYGQGVAVSYTTY